jgi:hypothetical protein
MIKFTWVITKALNYYLWKYSFTVYKHPEILLACSILVLPIMSLENTDIIFASVDEPIVDSIFASVDEPIVDNTWTTFYNKACSITTSTYEYSLTGLHVIAHGVYTVTNGAVLGLGIIAGVCVIQQPIEFAKLSKELVVNIFHTLGTQIIGEQVAQPIGLVLITSAAILGITLGLGNQLYTRYISTIIKPVEVLPPMENTAIKELAIPMIQILS